MFETHCNEDTDISLIVRGNHLPISSSQLLNVSWSIALIKSSTGSSIQRTVSSSHTYTLNRITMVKGYSDREVKLSFVRLQTTVRTAPLEL